MKRKDAGDHAEALPGLAGETVEAVQHVAGSRAAKKAEKRADKDEKKDVKKAKKDLKKDAKKAAKKGESVGDVTVAAVDGPKFTPKRARNAVGVAKVVAPAVIPILAPYAVRAAGAARDAYDRAQARRLGVGVDSIGEFSGKGAGLHARIAGVAKGLKELRESERATADDAAFADRGDSTLRQLAATVRASERMPGGRRRAAHKAVAGELGRLEDQLLHRLGV